MAKHLHLSAFLTSERHGLKADKTLQEKRGDYPFETEVNEPLEIE
jgi:hypothetical protein